MSGRPGSGELVGGEVAVGAVGSVLVVVDAPVLDEHLGFEEVVEPPAVEELVAEPAVERLDPGVLPWGAGVDEDRADPVEAAPVGHGVGDELGTVVEPDEGWCASGEHQPVEGGDDTVGVDGAVHDDGRALAGVLVDDVQQLQDRDRRRWCRTGSPWPTGRSGRSGTGHRRRCRSLGGASCVCGRAPSVLLHARGAGCACC